MSKPTYLTSRVPIVDVYGTRHASKTSLPIRARAESPPSRTQSLNDVDIFEGGPQDHPGVDFACAAEPGSAFSDASSSGSSTAATLDSLEPVGEQTPMLPAIPESDETPSESSARTEDNPEGCWAAFSRWLGLSWLACKLCLGPRR